MKATPLSKPPNDSITRVSALNAAAVHQLYRKTFNSEPPGGSVECARRKLAWHLQASREGGLPESARQHALAIAASSPARARIVSNVARRRQGLAMPNATATQLVGPRPAHSDARERHHEAAQRSVADREGAR